MLPLIRAAALAAAVWGQDYGDYLCREIREPFFRASGDSVRMGRREANPISFPAAKPPSSIRILVVGESVARLFWSAEGDALATVGSRAARGRKIEHLNAGMTAYNSRRIASVLKEGLAYRPDITVVMSGNNEHEGLELCPGVWEGLERQFRRSPLYRRFSPGGQDPVERGRELSLARHEWQLREMLRAAREQGLTILLATLPANEKDFPPDGAARWDSPDLARGLAELGRGRPGEAARAFESRLKTAPDDPFAHWFLARSLSKEPARALEHFERAVLLDPKGDRCSVERNAMIRRITGETGALLVDLAASFRKAAGGPVGGELLSDNVHWHPRLHPLVAAEILLAVQRSDARTGAGDFDAEVLEREAAAALRAPTPAERREELRKTWLYGVRQVSYWAGRDRDGDLNEVPVALLETVGREARDWLLESSKSKTALKPLLASNFWVRDLREDLDLWWPVYLAHLGEALRRRGEPAAAVRFLDQAVELSPKRRRYRLWRALALQAAGRKDDARREARELRSSDGRFAGQVLDAFGL